MKTHPGIAARMFERLAADGESFHGTRFVFLAQCAGVGRVDFLQSEAAAAVYAVRAREPPRHLDDALEVEFVAGHGFAGKGTSAIRCRSRRKTRRTSPQRRPGLQPASTILPIGRCTEGDIVTRVQRRLRELGYAVDVDGQFGPNTEGGVLAFQRSVGLPDTGVVDNATWAALFA